MIDFSKISLSPSSNISMIVDAELSISRNITTGGIFVKTLKELNLNADEKIFISCAVGAHRAAHTQWTHGEPVEIWRDEYYFLCVRYEDGNWWHYRQTETGYEWW